MKLSAISSRGSRKDFIDFCFLLQEYSLNKILLSFESKFSGIEYSMAHMLKSLTSLADAENSPKADYLKKIQW